jgi:pimeloyl-ACP methyl ester carboxylesterase
MPTRHAVWFDVTEAAGLGSPAEIRGTLFLPEAPRTPLIVALLVPGGGFSRHYYDLELPDHEGYSAAMQLAQAEILAVAVDNLGTGESTVPDDGRLVTLDVSAAAMAEVARQLRRGACEGTLHPSLRAGQPFVVGIGHSLGGCIVTLLEGIHAVCDATAILGFSCQYIRNAVDPKSGRRLRPRTSVGKGYNKTEPESHRSQFYVPDVPLAVIEAEEAMRVPMPDGLAEVLIPGRSAGPAGDIKVPILLAFGADDVSPDPREEPRYYRSSNDITLLIVEDCAHCHNSAPGRVGLWRRIEEWMHSSLIKAGA